jgi:large subunit ribosomal protein L16
MLIPKKTKYKKMQRGRLKGKANNNIKIIYGNYALQALESGWITSKQLEATQKIILRNIKKIGQVWIKVFPDKPITTRSTESRMGSGKGSVSFWVAVIKINCLLFEINCLSKDIAIKTLKLASYKLPIKTKILIK